ncbi:MAG: hypothetical protein AB7N76_04385 [Planctomycetota bacterium]
MTAPLPAAPPGYEPLDPAARRGGNAVYLVEGQRLLKVYRRRRGPWRELLARTSHAVFEGKRAPTARARRETELRALTLWRAAGCDVPAVLDLPPPEWLQGEPCLWLEFLPGRPLFWHLVDPGVPAAEKLELVTRLAGADRRRHERALADVEPLLIHEHATTKHVLLHGERLVTIDLEGGYLPGYPVRKAIGQELGGVLRSLWIDAAAEGPGPAPPPSQTLREHPLTARYLEAYGDPDALRAAARAALGGGPGAWLWRWSDRRRRRGRSKTAVLEQLLE